MIPDSLSAIANHLWQSTLAAGAAGLLTLALRKNPARVRHWVWVAASLKFLVPFSLLVAIGSRIGWRTAPAIAPSVSVVMEQFSQPFTVPTVSPPVLATAPLPLDPLPVILFGMWACGFIGISMWWWIRWRRIGRLVRAGSPVQLGIPISAISSPSILEPGVFGVFRPVLLLPEGIFEHLAPAQWKTVLAHELCHVRHRDNFVAVVEMFVETVFWFHPLVWWIGKRIPQERERACDEEVLRLGSERRTYAQAILKVCELYLKSPLECVAGVSGSNLSNRIEEIMSDRMVQRLVSPKKLLLAGTGVMAFAIPLVLGMWNTPRLRAQSQTPDSSLQAQNITGAWQGSLKAGDRQLRVVFKISVEDDKLKAVMYSIDQEGQGIPASAITRDGSTIKMTVATIGGIYEGKLASDGKVITGTWSKGAAAMLLNLARATPETAWAIPDPLPPPERMSADATPVFEVATIKPSRFGEGVRIGVNPSGLLETRGTSLSQLIKFAYDLHPRQIISGPPWLESDGYDVTGKPDTPGQPNINQLKAMVQKLLADRFQLIFHRDKRELPVYAITVAKSGPKLTNNDSDPSGLYGFSVGPRSLHFRNATMAEFASVLQASGGILDRPVVDQTGLGSARYDFMLNWTPDAPLSQLGGPGPNVPPPADNANVPPDLFTAFQQELGLKLESTKAPVDVLVIDHVERPSEN